jgi:hypothetical protein
VRGGGSGEGREGEEGGKRETTILRIDPFPKYETQRKQHMWSGVGDFVGTERINIMIQNAEEGGDLGVVVNDYTREAEYHSFANGILCACARGVIA